MSLAHTCGMVEGEDGIRPVEVGSHDKFHSVAAA